MEKVNAKTFRDVYGIIFNVGRAKILRCKLLPLRAISSLNRFNSKFNQIPVVCELRELYMVFSENVRQANQDNQIDLKNKLAKAKTAPEKELIRRSHQPISEKARELENEFNALLDRKLSEEENAKFDLDKARISISDIPSPQKIKDFFNDIDNSKEEIKCPDCGALIKVNTFNWKDQIIDAEIMAMTSDFIEWVDEEENKVEE